MTTEDLKVKRASVYVSNEDALIKEYVIGANFHTSSGTLERVDGGTVNKDGIQYATFYTGYGMEQSTTITYYNEANDNHDVQCEVNKLINDFMDLAVAKTIEEAND